MDVPSVAPTGVAAPLAHVAALTLLLAAPVHGADPDAGGSRGVAPVPEAAPAGSGPRATPLLAPQDTLPLEPTRRLRFTATRGTWISLDVSPDGGTLVFDLLGDLYTLPATGGTATRITSGQAFDGQPRFSPDGREIAFVSDRDGSDDVWVVAADGSAPRQLTKTDRRTPVSPEWTPDGEYVVVSINDTPVNRPRDWHLRLVHRTGGEGVPVTGPNAAADVDRNPGHPAWLGAAFGDDPRYLYAAAGSRGGPGSWQVIVLDRSTGRVYPRTVEAAGAFRPAVSPDGRWLVYGTRRDGATGLKLMELATGEESWLVEAVDRDSQEATPSRDLLPGYAFVPDGSAIVVAYGGTIQRVGVPGGEVTPIPFSADVDVPLGPAVHAEHRIDPETVRAHRIEYPAFSPDGSRIAFTAFGRVWVAPAEGGEPRRLTDADHVEAFPTWSPDGRSIAFASWDDVEGGWLWRMPADGSAPPRRLTDAPAFWEKLAWTPDGTRLVAARGPRTRRTGFVDELQRGRVETRELVWLPADGGPVTPITLLRVTDRWATTHMGRPHVSADGERILFTDPFDGLVSVRWDGSERRTRLRATDWEWTRVPEVPVDEILLSPDGDRALILANNQVWLVDVPDTGDPLPTLSLARSGSAPVPLERLTREGADFMGWAGPDRVWWAAGDRVSILDVSEAGRRGGDHTPERRRFPVTMPRDRGRGAAAFVGGRIVTMRGDEVIEDGVLVVEDGVIRAVGRRGDVAVPAGARTFDVGGRTIVPGWIDIHAHMWAPWGVHRTQVWEYLANLAWGVTTTRDPQTMTADVLSYADRVATGELLGPRVFTTGRGIFPSERIDSLEDARAVARRYADLYDTETVKNYIVGDRKHRQWLAMATREEGLNPTAEGNSDFKMNLTLALDGYAGMEHSLPVFPLREDVVRLFAESGITYTPTMLINYGGPNPENLFYWERDLHADEKLRRFFPHEELDRRTLRRDVFVHESQWVWEEESTDAANIVAAGGRVGLGGHGQLQGMQVHWEMWLLGEGGMPAHDVLRVATLFGAEAIGHGAELGSLEPGKLADLQILGANPLDDIRNTDSLERVMVRGRLYDADTLDEVWPRARPLPRPWWWDEGAYPDGAR